MRSATRTLSIAPRIATHNLQTGRKRVQRRDERLGSATALATVAVVVMQALISARREQNVRN